MNFTHSRSHQNPYLPQSKISRPQITARPTKSGPAQRRMRGPSQSGVSPPGGTINPQLRSCPVIFSSTDRLAPPPFI
ncbi:unnamed protein product [Leptosia nina]|uniref:Uncharacterized protein n=1 Tax=Leptosia nina TaxID=320188 RepID=A0AAV1K362_9NEOP